MGYTTPTPHPQTGSTSRKENAAREGILLQNVNTYHHQQDHRKQGQLAPQQTSVPGGTVHGQEKNENGYDKLLQQQLLIM